MKFSLPFDSVLASGAASLLVLAHPAEAKTTVQIQHSNVARALYRDLATIQPGSQPTEAQKQALSDDLGQLFYYVGEKPAVTLDYAADRLAGATAQGHFLDGELHTIANKLTSILGGRTDLPNSRIIALKSVFGKAGVERTSIKQLAEALRALPISFISNSDGTTSNYTLRALTPEIQGYHRAAGTISAATYRGIVYNADGTIDPAGLTRTLSVTLNQLPLGRYQINVTTGSGTQAVELGTIRVKENVVVFPVSTVGAAVPGTVTHPFTSQDDTGDGGNENPTDEGTTGTTAVPGGSTSIGGPSYYGSGRSGYAVFGDSEYYQSLPAGLSLADVTGVTITDARRVERMSVSFLPPTVPQTSRSAGLHLKAGTTVPLANGSMSISLTVVKTTKERVSCSPPWVFLPVPP